MNLTADRISFSYRTHPVLHTLSCSFDTGITAILGANGTGKSTLLRLLAGLLRPQSGTVFANGKAISTLSPRECARTVAYLPQKIAFPACTVFDAVLSGRLPHIGWRASEDDLAAVQSALMRLDLAQFALRPACDLSGGEQQKLAIARALAQEAPVLLLDEPTSSLDLRAQSEFVRLLRSLSTERSLTVVAVLHDLNLALRAADRFLLLKDGGVLAAGGSEILTPENVLAAYGIHAAIETVAGQAAVIPLNTFEETIS